MQKYKVKQNRRIAIDLKLLAVNVVGKEYKKHGYVKNISNSYLKNTYIRIYMLAKDEMKQNHREAIGLKPHAFNAIE